MKRPLMIFGMGILILAGIIFVGCERTEPLSNYPTGKAESETSVEIVSRYMVQGQTIVVFYDSARNVTCWFSPYFRQGGISCLEGER